MSCGASEVVSIVCASEASTSQLLRTMSAQSSRAASSRVGQPDAWGRLPIMEVPVAARNRRLLTREHRSFRAAAKLSRQHNHGRSLHIEPAARPLPSGRRPRRHARDPAHPHHQLYRRVRLPRLVLAAEGLIGHSVSERAARRGRNRPVAHATRATCALRFFPVRGER